jgi:hypothetical protein
MLLSQLKPWLCKSLKHNKYPSQGGRMGCFQTKNTYLGKFWRVLQWKLLVYFMAIWSILRPFGIFCGYLVYFMVICYIFPRYGMRYLEKSGNPNPSAFVNLKYFLLLRKTIQMHALITPVCAICKCCSRRLGSRHTNNALP